ncbi:MAG: amidohydrolase family protein, partial [Acetobacteraceae bacterium]
MPRISSRADAFSTRSIPAWASRLPAETGNQCTGCAAPIPRALARHRRRAIADWKGRAHDAGSIGVVGIRLNLLCQPNPDFASPSWQQFLGHLVTQRWQVELQVEAGRLPAVIPLLLRARVTRAVVDHFERPDPKLGIDDPGFRFLLLSRNLGCAWVKLSGACRNGNTAEVAARSLLWGSVQPTW